MCKCISYLWKSSPWRPRAPRHLRISSANNKSGRPTVRTAFSGCILMPKDAAAASSAASSSEAAGGGSSLVAIHFLRLTLALEDGPARGRRKGNHSAKNCTLGQACPSWPAGQNKRERKGIKSESGRRKMLCFLIFKSISIPSVSQIRVFFGGCLSVPLSPPLPFLSSEGLSHFIPAERAGGIYNSRRRRTYITHSAL